MLKMSKNGVGFCYVTCESMVKFTVTGSEMTGCGCTEVAVGLL